ncbi:MAG TPA: VOC family protein [Thermoplasmata archaeon]|nr:VOC family protein [Thermoplasmata archaeon]
MTAALIVPDAARAIEIYARALGAEQLVLNVEPDGKTVTHAEIGIGDSRIFLGDEAGAMGAKSPKTLGGTTASIHLYFEDADALYDRAVSAGAKGVMPPMDMFWGDRYARVVDPYGHEWGIATHIADPTPEQMEKDRRAFFERMTQRPPGARSPEGGAYAHAESGAGQAVADGGRTIPLM